MKQKCYFFPILILPLLFFLATGCVTRVAEESIHTSLREEYSGDIYSKAVEYVEEHQLSLQSLEKR